MISTPHRNSQSQLSAKDTPLNKGSSTDYAWDTKHNQSDYAPYLMEDIRRKKTVTFDDFLKHVLAVPEDWEMASSYATLKGEGSPYEANLATFRAIEHRNIIHGEKKLYRPFADLVNSVVDHMLDASTDTKDKPYLRLRRNDPAYIRGSYARRKPDLVAVPTAQYDKRQEELDEAPDPNFSWNSVLGFIEFKVGKQNISHSLFNEASF